MCTLERDFESFYQSGLLQFTDSEGIILFKAPFQFNFNRIKIWTAYKFSRSKIELYNLWL